NVSFIKEAFAQRFFRNQNPIGKHLGQHGMGSARDYEIVGIVTNARNVSRDIAMPLSPFFSLPEAQHDLLPKDASADANPGSPYLHDIVIVVKPGVSLSSVQVRQALADVDPNLPIISIRTLSEQVASQFTQQRLIARLTSFFGVLSLILAS